jgi:AcrR family transcriptional regulator
MTLLRSKRDEVRKAILDSARNIAASDGWQAVTVRRVADEIHYTAPVVYEHFANKDDLLITIVIESYDQLGQIFQGIYDMQSDPSKRLHEIGKAYWHFAMTEPRLYELMTGRGGVDVSDSGRCGKAAKLCLIITMRAVQALFDVSTSDEEAKLQSVSLWALMHGLVALVTSKQVSESEAKLVLENALNNFIQQKKG